MLSQISHVSRFFIFERLGQFHEQPSMSNQAMPGVVDRGHFNRAMAVESQTSRLHNSNVTLHFASRQCVRKSHPCPPSMFFVCSEQVSLSNASFCVKQKLKNIYTVKTILRDHCSNCSDLFNMLRCKIVRPRLIRWNACRFFHENSSTMQGGPA